MKRLTNLTLATMAMLSANAQLKLNSNTQSLAFSKAIETVLGDFPYNYRHITGELVLSQGDFREYASTVTLPGSQHCAVAHYNSALDTTASWQAEMLRTESFTEAADEYRHLYKKLQQCKLKMVDGSSYFLDGEFEEITEAMDFATSTLHIQTADERFTNFKVELELLYLMDEWVIHINMVSKKKDSEERPDWWEGN